MTTAIYDTLVKNNSVIGIDGKGSIKRYSGGFWISLGKRLPPEDPREIAIQRLIDKGWRRAKLPSLRQMEKWVENSVAKTPCGCSIELDGTCPHGSESWIRILGMV